MQDSAFVNLGDAHMRRLTRAHTYTHTHSTDTHAHAHTHTHTTDTHAHAHTHAQEAAGLGDADLDTQKEGALRVSPHRSYNRVFGNTLYEEARQQIDEEQGQGQQQANAQASQYGDSFTADPVEPHTPYIAGMPGTFEEGHVDHGAYAQGGGDLVNEDGDGLGTGPGSHGGRTSWGMGRPESIRRSMRGSFNSRAAQVSSVLAFMRAHTAC
eukprot:1158369-Pelagomonas_calceolata.AAC.6